MMSHPKWGGKASPLAGQSILNPRAARLAGFMPGPGAGMKHDARNQDSPLACKSPKP